MDKEILVLPFGKKIQVGNFTVLKYTKTLTKDQLRQLREEKDIPQEMKSKLSRAGLPYIKVEAVSQIWSVEFCCITAVYTYIDTVLSQAIAAADRNDYSGIADFAHLFGMWMTDTCIQGDEAYYDDKARAIQALLDRQKAFEGESETDAEKATDDKILEETKAAVVDMAHGIKEGGDDGSDE